MKTHNRYCVELLFETVDALYGGISHEGKAYFFSDYAEAEAFMLERREQGYPTSNVMDLDNLPF